ncbi:Ammonium transporter NrgA [archaeon HR06]|nr:Ammonium transporter NrgA [archaeon HR06]
MFIKNKEKLIYVHFLPYYKGDCKMPIDSGDTAWLLASSALVMIMTPGLAFFYGGLVRRKNVNAIIMQCFTTMLLVGVIWILWGYSLAFGPDVGGFIGSLDWIGLNNVGLEPYEGYSSTVPHQAYMIFQAMFAIITPALIVGAFADRMKFGPFILFIILWSTFVYSPIAHWVWGIGGWIRNLGALDFAGGTVVHINAGVAALASALIIGKRKGYGKLPMVPHNVPLVVLGTSLLWFGWFGFNAGSAISAGSLSTSAFVVTNTATAMAALTWLIVGWIHRGTPSIIGACSGAVAGLVAITPASGFVNPLGALAIGIGAGIFCYLAVQWKNKVGFDDALDVWGVHGIGGTWGAIATGIFATTSVNPAGANGLIYGNALQLIPQLVGVGATWTYSFIVTWIILKVLDKTMGLRVKPEEEEIGLDIAIHSEEAYSND